MRPGWYSQAHALETAAYFDGETWGEPTKVASLDSQVRESISVVAAPPAPPVAEAPDAIGESSSRSDRKGGTGWWWGITAGAALILIGIIFGFQPAGSYCGAPFKESNLAEYMDALAPDYGYSTDYASECRDDMASATATTWVLIGLGVLVSLVSALIMATVRSGRARASAARPVVETLASRIEDLARLRDKGLISPEEYESKRLEILHG